MCQRANRRGFTLMGADTPPGIEHRPGKDIAVSLSGDDVDEDRTLTLLG
jgi:PhnB protein